MKKSILYIVIICFIFSCENNPEQQQQSSAFINSEIESTQLSIQVENEHGFNITELKIIIDSIYQLNISNFDSIKIETVKTFFDYYQKIETENSTTQIESESVPPEEKYLLHPLYAFSPQNAEYLFEYGPFSVLQFNNDSLARSAFAEIFELFRKEENGFNYTTDSIRLFYDVFSKGGCSYFYKSKFIILKYRRCNDNYQKHENYEDALIDFLYPKHLPENGGYFMRFCCSCPEYKISEYR